MCHGKSDTEGIGDGTTTATVLAAELCDLFVEYDLDLTE